MKLTYKITMLFASFFFTSAALFAQDSKGYEIDGHISGLKDGDKLVMNMMVYPAKGAEEIPRDSGFVKNGQFHISGYVPDGPRIYWLRFKDSKGEGRVYRMYIDNNQQIKLSLDKDVNQIHNELLDLIITCTGSPSNYAFRLIRAVDESYALTGSINDQLDRTRESGGYNKDVIDALMAAKRKSDVAFNNRFLSPVAPDILPGAPLLIFYEDGHDLAWEDVYNQLDEHLRNSVCGKKMKEILPLLVGKEMPGFILPDNNGKTVNLKDIVSKSKVTLVRFWATNSYDWKTFDNELKAMYKLYHDRGLNILAVSSDPYEEQWKETISKENHPWLDVFDKKGEKFVTPVYHEQGNPDKPNTTNVVLDSQGKIIAWDPTGAALQYYILKTLGE